MSNYYACVAFVLVLLGGCSDDSAPPQTQQPTKTLSETEKIICSSSYKTWKFTAIYKGSANVIRQCAINDDWVFRYDRTLEIKNTGVSCDGNDTFQEHAWNLSKDEKTVFMGTSTFAVLKMTAAEMRLQENVGDNLVFVYNR
ncbi:MAG TPA: hypothetical protein VGD65_03260 [Chryseosolibacter sp.]